MLNQVILVGRLTDKPKMQEVKNGKKITVITIAISRPFKSINGEYDCDFIDCILWDNMASNTIEYCKKGDMLGIRGRIQSSSYKKNKLEVFTEKVTFLTNSK